MTNPEDVIRNRHPLAFMYITARPDGTLVPGGPGSSLGDARMDAMDGGTVYELKYKLDRVWPVDTWPAQPEPEDEDHA